MTLNLMTATRKQINDRLCQLARNEFVSGMYYGVSFSGIGIDERGITTRPYDIELKVKLNHPVVVYGQERDTLVLNGGLIFGDNGNGKYTVNEL